MHAHKHTNISSYINKYMHIYIVFSSARPFLKTVGQCRCAWVNEETHPYQKMYTRDQTGVKHTYKHKDTLTHGYTYKSMTNQDL